MRKLLTCVGLMAATCGWSAEPTKLLWGDTHLHTSHSTDAYASGNLTVNPDQAYRLARGLPIEHPVLHSKVQLARPLDFLVVADHSDFLGIQVYLQKDDPRLTSSERGRRLRELTLANPGAVFRMIFGGNPEFSRDQLMETYKPIQMQPWLDEIGAAEKNNQPGVFTAFAGWEWSAQPNSANLHRVVFSAASADQLRQFFPISNIDTQRPEDLWAWLEKTSKAINADFVAIPHNSNMSIGTMFERIDSDGRPITAEYARTRARWEPVMEISQVKGTSEALPELSPNDEFAEFEIFRRLFTARRPVPSKADYGRYALLTGLELGKDLGVNPYKLGFIGGTDIHTGMSTTDENAFGGAIARDAALTARQAAPRNRAPDLAASLNAWELSASGLAGVWAQGNTRQDIAAAVKRKEVYATSGTRISLRVFGGFGFQARDARALDVAAIGYKGGVPMGGDLSSAPKGKPVSLLIHAVRDPQGANLDRVQVVKGWLDRAGTSHEKIFDVAWSGERRIGADGKLPAVGNTVDATTATYRNSIGAAQLSTVWKDPEFDATQAAFYYVRVLEIPTPRHQVHDTVALNMAPEEAAQPLSIQERAWSSAIWYSPQN
jgi:hypothetical protein